MGIVMLPLMSVITRPTFKSSPRPRALAGRTCIQQFVICYVLISMAIKIWSLVVSNHADSCFLYSWNNEREYIYI